MVCKRTKSNITIIVKQDIFLYVNTIISGLYGVYLASVLLWWLGCPVLKRWKYLNCYIHRISTHKLYTYVVQFIQWS